MANIKDYIKKIQDGTVSLEEQQQALAQVEQTIREEKQKRDEAIGKSTDMVVEALKKIEERLNNKYQELLDTPAMKGEQGPQGPAGKDGKDGVNGYNGKDGKDGIDGKDGQDGKDGVSVIDASIDFDGSLLIKLSDGSEIDAGTVIPLDVAKQIHSVSTNGGGTSQSVLDTLTSLQSQIDAISTGAHGIPVGGTTGQILAKASATDYDATWIDNYATQLKMTVKNDQGTALTKGQVVYVSGANGTNVLVKLAKADSDITSATTIGFLEQDLAINGIGLVVLSGALAGIDTSAASAGDPIWLSGSTAGGVIYGIANKPVAPVHLVYLGVVTRAQAINGEIDVKVNNGWELEELHNVLISAPVDNQVLTYEAATNLWKNKTPTGGGGSGTVTSVAATGGTGISVTGSPITSSGTLTITNTAPDQTVVLTQSAPITVSGTYPSFTIGATQATTSTNGYLSSTDWNTFNNKQPAGSYLTTVTASTPLSGSGTSGSPLVISQATTSTNGYLTSTDWNTFNNKQATLVSGTNIKTINGTSVLGSGDIAVSAAAGGSNTQIQYNSSGALAGATNLVYDGTNLGVGMTPDGSSWVQVAAGTASKAPFELTTSAGTLMTTPDDGSIEYDGKAFYGTPVANSRGVMPTEHFVARTGTKTMTSNTSLQSIFGGGTGGLTNGALTVSASESYYFECLVTVSGMSATSGNFGFSLTGGGTATFTSAGFIAIGYDQTTLTTPAAASAGGTYIATSALTTNVVTATTGTSAAVLFKGIFRINAGGTIIPSIQLTTASAATIGANCWFKCYPVGSDTVISVGNWS